jgi:hypothetical protein
MSNHFHILVEVPQRPAQLPDDAQLLARLKRLYSPEAFARIRWQLENLRGLGANKEAEVLRESFFRRMWDARMGPGLSLSHPQCYRSSDHGHSTGYVTPTAR